MRPMLSMTPTLLVVMLVVVVMVVVAQLPKMSMSITYVAYATIMYNVVTLCPVIDVVSVFTRVVMLWMCSRCWQQH